MWTVMCTSPLRYSQEWDLVVIRLPPIHGHLKYTDKLDVIDWMKLSRVEVWRWIFLKNAVKCGEKNFTAYFLHLFAVNAVNRGELFIFTAFSVFLQKWSSPHGFEIFIFTAFTATKIYPKTSTRDGFKLNTRIKIFSYGGTGASENGRRTKI